MRSNRTFLRWVVLCGAAAVCALCIIVAWSIWGPPHRNMRIAERHLHRYEGLLASDPRYASFDVGTEYRESGGLRVRGELDTTEQLDALEHLLRSSDPPVPIYIRVLVAEQRMMRVVEW